MPLLCSLHVANRDINFKYVVILLMISPICIPSKLVLDLFYQKVTLNCLLLKPTPKELTVGLKEDPCYVCCIKKELNYRCSSRAINS